MMNRNMCGAMALIAAMVFCAPAMAQPAAERPASKARNTKAKKGRQPKMPPTFANVQYDEYPQTVLDFWKAESKTPTPFVLFIHGGGFRGGSKNSINVDTLNGLLKEGISVAAVEYRLIGVAKLPAAHHDCRRALQFMRSKAKEWNLDKERAGAFGGSAGAQICMWLGFHDEMADPKSKNPRERESSRLMAVSTNGGQTTMDFDWWMKHIPGYDKPHRERGESYGEMSEEEYRKGVESISALSLISKDDPPIFMSYGMRPDDPIPTDAKKANGWKVHHVNFGVELKKVMDKLGVEAELKYPKATAKYRSTAQFFIEKLRGN